MTTIEVTRVDGDEPMRFAATVLEDDGSSRHEVTMDRSTAARLTSNQTQRERSPEQVVEAAFRFLLDHEPRQSIMSRFDITVIARYFPDFEERLPEYLARV